MVNLLTDFKNQIHGLFISKQKHARVIVLIAFVVLKLDMPVVECFGGSNSLFLCNKC